MTVSVENRTSPAIELVGVGKKYTKLEERATLLRSVLPFARPKRSELWAVRGVDLTVQRGEVIGMIGRNGSGKSSLLRIVAGVTRPTEGSVRVRGRIAPLLSVGVGFQKEMSGRENVYLNGMLLGLDRDEIASRFHEIVGFAELANFIDTPVKFYSSGMYMRLGFSVAVHTNPQVLLVDEVLAVGDSAFQAKCLRRVKEIRETGTTIVMVSHSMPAIEQLCPRVVVVRRGRVEFDGPAREAMSLHHQLLTADAREAAESAGTPGAQERRLVGGVQLLDLKLLSEAGATHSFEAGSALVLRARYRFDRTIDDPVFALRVMGPEGSAVYGCHTAHGRHGRTYGAGDDVEVDYSLRAHVGQGTYQLLPWVVSFDAAEILFDDPVGLSFFVPANTASWGAVDLDARISVGGQEGQPNRPFRLALDSSTDS
ncbi:MAG: ABC transporter ATP-binding protein [Candidatus Dormibacteraeota bacterium]|nr:ABC transporter ATP-binding protein [Candidatus Dormibacteraeota bacterium]